MLTIDDNYQSYPLVKQSKVRKLRTYTSSASCSSVSGSSANNSPIVDKQKIYQQQQQQHHHHHHHHHHGDTDEGYASFTTASTTLGSNNSATFNKDDSAYSTSVSERLFTATTTASSSSSSSRVIVETDSDKSELSDEDDALKELVDWPSLNKQVQTLVSRLDKWLHNPLPDRYIPIEKSFVEHAYPVLNRRTSSIPLSINLAADETEKAYHQSNYIVNFVQNNEVPQQKKAVPKIHISRPHVHFNLPTEQLQHCTTCSRLIQLTSSKFIQRSLITCPYCEQIYCSKACQKSDWPIHKRQCILSNSYSCCGYILRLMKSNVYLLERLSTLASSGYLSSGRGATLLYFNNMQEADAYVQSNTIENTRLMAVYWSLADTQPNRAIENLRSTEYDHLKELCMNYDPSKEFVCHVTIGVEADKGKARYTCVSRTTIHKLLETVPNSQAQANLPSTYPTLYLTSLNYGEKNNTNNQHMRQVFFAKLQVELRQRGIEIEEHYPELYNKLCDYISTTPDNEKIVAFTPVCLFMRHRYSQQLFMCVITPESEPDRSWLLDRCLIEKQLTICDN
ncbi:unnamed protein product [Rotaria socialis]|uniref:MYND-type domain-containing protein n=1 Tax=Rotaria socialis TaxID=392032 RepID=A0A820KIG0_9BILA|nr:unnamed protein product [Rotaria socialis]CAF3461969.1 unnamed protein product [Rotaria socialis]CAF4343207.1 unnamed protein product [Rotaria socialis]CAF4416596.1 unnamed protein product [Rotaria socialis]